MTLVRLLAGTLAVLGTLAPPDLLGPRRTRDPGPASAQLDNRLWWAEFELRGPVRALRIDCGDAGETQVELELVAGEERRLSLPLPARSPIGASGLGAVARPRPDFEGEGQVRFVAWASDQSAQALERLPRGLVGRSRPTGRRSNPGPGGDGGSAGVGERLRPWVPLALVLSTWLALRAARRKPPLAAALVTGLSVCVFLLAARPVRGPLPTRVLEGLAEAPSWLWVEGGVAELSITRGRPAALTSEPPAAALRFLLRFDGERVSGVARAVRRGTRLFGLSPVSPWESRANPRPALDRLWTRSALGVWSSHGPWSADSELPPALETGGSAAVPGWLAAGTPPGRALLVGSLAAPRDGSAVWVRLVGFGERD